MRPAAVRGAVFRKDAIAGTRALPIDRRRMRRTGGSEHPGEKFRRCGTLSPRWPALRRAPRRRRRRRRQALRCRSRCRRRALRRQRGRCPPRCASIRRRPSRKSRTGQLFCLSDCLPQRRRKVQIPLLPAYRFSTIRCCIRLLRRPDDKIPEPFSARIRKRAFALPAANTGILFFRPL